jgi:hypothetical protein
MEQRKKMKTKIFLAFLLIILFLTPVYSQKQYESKSHCFSICQSAFRDQLNKCRTEKENTAMRTTCLDKARIMLNDCLDECRDLYPNKLK